MKSSLFAIMAVLGLATSQEVFTPSLENSERFLQEVVDFQP